MWSFTYGLSLESCLGLLWSMCVLMAALSSQPYGKSFWSFHSLSTSLLCHLFRTHPPHPQLTVPPYLFCSANWLISFLLTNQRCWITMRPGMLDPANVRTVPGYTVCKTISQQIPLCFSQCVKLTENCFPR